MREAARLVSLSGVDRKRERRGIWWWWWCSGSSCVVEVVGNFGCCCLTVSPGIRHQLYFTVAGCVDHVTQMELEAGGNKLCCTIVILLLYGVLAQ